MDFTFQTDQIKIFVDTQIPNYKPVAITQSILGIDTINTYPYFTGWFKYEKDILLRKSYDEKIKFFFNEETFLEAFKGKTKGSVSTQFINENIDIMIQVLFPTVYPLKNDNTTSFQVLTKTNKIEYSLKGAIPFGGILRSFNNNFSYIHLNKSIYTVTSTCVLNDITNHPEYSKILQDFLAFQSWRFNTKNIIKQKLYRLKLNIHSIIVKDYSTTQQIRHEMDGSYVRKESREHDKKVYIDNLLKLFNELLKIPNEKEEDYIKSLQNLERSIKDNTFSISTRFIDITKHIKEYTELSLTNNFYFIFTRSIDKVDVTTERYLESNYKEYPEFFTKVSQFDKDHRSSLNEHLQKMIDDYVNKKNFLFESLLLYINDKYIRKRENVIISKDLIAYKKSSEKESSLKKLESMENLLFIGVSKYNYLTQNNLAYEVYVHFNLISGKLDNNNYSSISCSYKNEVLGDAFLDINEKEVKIKKPIIDLKTMLISKDPTKNNSRVGGNRRNTKTFRKKNNNKGKRVIRRRKRTRKKTLSY